jgi:hypothetical protein
LKKLKELPLKAKELTTAKANTAKAKMSSKLVPKNPEEVMVIRDISPLITTLSVPFLRFGLIKVGGRATVGMLSLLFPLRKTSIGLADTEKGVW